MNIQQINHTEKPSKALMQRVQKRAQELKAAQNKVITEGHTSYEFATLLERTHIEFAEVLWSMAYEFEFFIGNHDRVVIKLNEINHITHLRGDLMQRVCDEAIMCLNGFALMRK